MHALVEKPICLKSKQAEDLIKISKKKNKILMVGHLHLFNPGIQKLKADIKLGLFGKIRYISIFHSGNGPVRTDISALWDFFPHSVSILLYLLEKYPVVISADGAAFLKKGNEDIAVMSLKFPNNIFATSTGSWIYPAKKLEIVVGGEKMYAVFDDYAQESKLKYYKGIDCRNVHIENFKPLTAQIEYFLNCVRSNKIKINGGKAALDVTKILELAQKSLRNGVKIKIGRL